MRIFGHMNVMSAHMSLGYKLRLDFRRRDGVHSSALEPWSNSAVLVKIVASGVGVTLLIYVRSKLIFVSSDHNFDQ